METARGGVSRPTPSASKACSRCRARKVKCDMLVPRCSACLRNNDECNMIDCVSYPYSEIQKLQDQIHELQDRLKRAGATERSAQNAAATAAEPNGSLDNIHGSTLYSSDRQAEAQDVRKEAEEIGILAIAGSRQHSSHTYAGSATGSTFVRIFLKQLRFTIPSVSSAHPRGLDLNPSPTTVTAGLPSPAIAQLLLNVFIARIHVWWPLLSLPEVRQLFQKIYHNASRCSDFDKFLVFILLALASNEVSTRDDYRRMRDVNTPLSYFQTSLRYFASLGDDMRELSGIQSLTLLGVWMLGSNVSSYSNELWQLSRYTMSLAIEIGLHRHNSDWGFSSDDLEIRNRTWWSVYALERQVAVSTGRVLSIRDHAVQALMPSPCSLDQLSSSEQRSATTFHAFKVWPFNHMIRLRRLAGRVLESVYIARAPDGRCPSYSFQELCAICDQIRLDLEEWKKELDNAGLKPSRECSELKIEYCIVLLLLNRPSPTFMVPSREMLATCSRASSSAIRQWDRIRAEHGISAVCRCFRQLHAILLVGLAALYCDWQSSMIALTNTAMDQRASVLRHDRDTAIALNLIEQGLELINDSYLYKYRDLFHAVRQKVYGSSAEHVNAGYDDNLFLQTGSSMDVLDNVGGPDNMQPLILSHGDGLEQYRDQVTGFLDAGVIDMDNMLSAWYDSIMDDSLPERFL